jgi:TctA family transporter
MYIGNLILVGLNLPLVGLFVSMLRIPFGVLFPIILLTCLIGTYSVNLSSFELLVLLGSGVLGYFFRKLKYDLAPFILALIIGPTLEETFRQSLMRSAGSFSIFWQRPITLTLIGFALLLLAWNIYKGIRGAGRVAKSDGC